MGFWRRSGPRLVAAMLVALVLGDLSDAACDPIGWPGPASDAALSGLEAGGPDDACATSCVQDCFCCSRSEAPDSAAAVPKLTPVAEASALDAVSIVPVVRAVPQRPPLALS